MLERGTCIKIVVVSLLALTLQHVARLVVQLGVFSHFYQHYPGQCKKVDSMQKGSEDFHTLPSGLTFITSGIRQHKFGAKVDEHFHRHKIRGAIFLFDLNKTEAGVTRLKIQSSDLFDVDTFYPHGISIWEDKVAGRHTVFVVNHPRVEPVADRVEKFVFDAENLELIHQAYYTSDTMKVLNSIVATGPTSFYFTNYEYHQTVLGTTLEILFQLKWTDVVYFDGTSYTVVAADMLSPNGIAMSNDGQYVYVAPCVGQEIRVFLRNKETNSLTLQQVYPLYRIPDNIKVDHNTGDLYVGCHPIGYKVLEHLDDPSVLSPSQVLHLRVRGGNIVSAQELFYDHGTLISGSTSAIVFNKKLLIGSIFHNLVTCDVNVPL